MRIGIIGHFGGDRIFNDGQTVKTLTIYDAMMRRSTEEVQLHKVDTYYIKSNIVKFCFQFASCALHDKKIIVLLSKKGRTILFPIMYILSRYFKKEFYHYGIGGRLANEVKQKRNWKKYVSSFKANWMESREIVNHLNHIGVKNAVYVPNFKNLNIPTREELKKEYNAPYKFCIFSRVMAEKGVEDAIQAIIKVNKLSGCEIAQLDIYGPIEKGYEKQLDLCLKEADKSCKYCGVIPSTQSVEVLKDYYALLFPTHWRHEGIPGTIIDALSAGIPVIARRWQYCDEMLEHNKTGYVYEFNEPERLPEVIWYAIQHHNETIAMKENCLNRAYDYSEQRVIKQIAIQMGISVDLS